jgi:hypothetical protein
MAVVNATATTLPNSPIGSSTSTIGFPSGDVPRSQAESDARRLREQRDIECSVHLSKLKERARRRRLPWISIFQEVYDYVFPYRQGFFTDFEGRRKTDYIYDQTAVVGTPRFASQIQHGLFPPQANAFVLGPGVDVPKAKQTRQLQGEFDAITEAFHAGLRSSNFETELNEAAQDLAIGTMTLLVEPGTFPGQLKFTSVPHNNLYILNGSSDRVGLWDYEQEITYAEVAENWPYSDPNAAMIQAFKNQPDGKVKIDQITVHNPANLFEEQYDYYLWCEAHRCVLDHRTYSGRGSCPWITARWSKTSLEVWGRGPLLQCLPSIKTVNLVVQMVLENAELAIAGVFAYDDDGVFNPDNIRIEPGTFVPRAVGSKIDPLQSPARFDISTLVLNDERMNIKKALFIDELDSEGLTPKSAEEISQRMADKARNMGSVSGRLKNELLDPLVDRIRYIYLKQGLIEMPVIDGKTVKLVPLSPLLRIQDQAEISNFVQYVQTLNGTLGQGISTAALNQAKTINWLSTKFGIPSEINNTAAQILDILAKAGAAAAQTGTTPELMKTAVQTGLNMQG